MLNVILFKNPLRSLLFIQVELVFGTKTGEVTVDSKLLEFFITCDSCQKGAKVA